MERIEMALFEGQRVVVVGLGASGLAAARVLREEGALVRVTEARERETLGVEAEDLSSLGVRIDAGGHLPEHLVDATLVVASPGVTERADILRWAARARVPVISELELGARLCGVPYAAVTGTNGKSTTTEMIAAMMRSAGLDAIACGNIGHPFSLAAREHHDALVVEASSFQLRFHRSFRPRVSVLLNIAPDHLDWHVTFEAYAQAKARVFELQGPGDVHVGNRDDAHASEASASAPCETVWFRLGEPRADEVGYVEGHLVARIGNAAREAGEVSLGAPNGHSAGFRADAAAASAAALGFGLAPEAVAEGLSLIRPLPHRGQVVAEVGGVRFIDDSKATNPHAALAALEDMRDAVLIAGGLAKGVDLSPLATATPRLLGVVAIGEAAPEVAAVFEGRVPVRMAGSIEQAVREAHSLAPTGGVVVLAPACASMDMFRDYAERGERFAAAAERLEAEVAARG
jgi:UDP-N-acetylmuramoylalanine--D-glutamate ligase